MCFSKGVVNCRFHGAGCHELRKHRQRLGQRELTGHFVRHLCVSGR